MRKGESEVLTVSGGAWAIVVVKIKKISGDSFKFRLQRRTTSFLSCPNPAHLVTKSHAIPCGLPRILPGLVDPHRFLPPSALPDWARLISYSYTSRLPHKNKIRPMTIIFHPPRWSSSLLSPTFTTHKQQSGMIHISAKVTLPYPPFSTLLPWSLFICCKS